MASELEARGVEVPEAFKAPVASECATCRTNGHFCAAVRYVNAEDDLVVCQACYDGVPCAFAVVRSQREPDLYEPEPNYTPPKAVSIPVTQWAPTDVVKQSTTSMEDIKNRPSGRGIPVPEPVKQLIIAELDAASNTTLAAKYNVSMAFVSKLRTVHRGVADASPKELTVDDVLKTSPLEEDSPIVDAWTSVQARELPNPDTIIRVANDLKAARQRVQTCQESLDDAIKHRTQMEQTWAAMFLHPQQ